MTAFNCHGFFRHFCQVVMALLLGITLVPSQGATDEQAGAREETKAAKDVATADSEQAKPGESHARGPKASHAVQLANDPDVRMLITSRIRDQIIARYGAFAAEAGMSDEARMKFVDFLVKQKIDTWQSGGAFAAPLSATSRNEMAHLFGEDTRAKFDYFEKTAPVRKVVDKLQHRLEVLGIPMDGKQRASLIAYIMSLRDGRGPSKDGALPSSFLDKRQLAEYEALTLQQRLTKQMETRYGAPFLSLSSAVDDR